MILTYNALSTLEETLDKITLSVLHQDRPNTEVTVVDNGVQQAARTSTLRGNVIAVKIAELGKNYGYCLVNNMAPLILRDFLAAMFPGPVLVMQSSEAEDFSVYRYLLRGFMIVGKDRVYTMYDKPLWRLAAVLLRIVSRFSAVGVI